MHTYKIILRFIFCFSLSVPAAYAQCWEGTTAKVIDGNSLLVSRSNTSRTVRLYGIAAPVSGQNHAFHAKKELTSLVLNRKVTVCPEKLSPGLAAEVYVLKGFMLSVNQEMVRKGLARSTIALYQSLEKKARGKGLGLWSKDRSLASKDNSSNRSRSFSEATDNAESNAAGGLSVYTVTPSAISGRKIDNSTQEKDFLNEKRQAELNRLRSEKRMQTVDDSLSYTDIDQVEISSEYMESGYKEDGTLEIVFKYTSDELGRRVNWDDGEVNCDCSAVGHFSEGTNTRIARTSLSLSSSRDRAFIDIPYRYFDDSFIELNSITVECRLSAGIFDLKASDKVYLKFTGRPRFYPRPRHY